MTTSTGGMRPLAGCSTTATEEAARSVTSAGVGATMGAIGSANAAPTSAPLLLEMGVTPSDAVYPA